MFAVRSRRTSLRIDSGRSTVILNSGIVILYCHSERNTVILNEVKNLIREPGGRESLWCSRSFADAQDDRRNAQDDRSDAQDDRRRQLKIISVMRNLKTMDLLYGN